MSCHVIISTVCYSYDPATIGKPSGFFGLGAKPLPMSSLMPQGTLFLPSPIHCYNNRVTRVYDVCIATGDSEVDPKLFRRAVLKLMSRATDIELHDA